MDDQASRPLCRATRADGTPCKARAMPGQTLCFGHNDTFAAKRHAARCQGGRNRANAIRLGKLVPSRLVPVFERLQKALDDTLEGRLPPASATAAASLARALAALLQAGELEERVRQLETASREGPPRKAGMIQ